MTKAAFSPHRIDRDQLKPLRDAVIVGDMTFTERLSRGGLILPSDNGKSSGIRPRWGRGRWTRGIEIEDENGKQTLRRVDPKDVMLESDEEPQDTTFSAAIHVEAKPAHMQHN